MEMYQIDVDYLTGLPKDANFRHGLGQYEGVVMHETAVEGDSVKRNKMVFGNYGWKRMEAFVHAFVDDKAIWLSADTRYPAWGAGPVANKRYLHIELCRVKTKAEFLASYDRWVWLAAKFLKDKKLGVIDGKTLVSHDWVRRNLGGTTHTDPIAYLKRWGKTWDDVVKDVKNYYDNGLGTVELLDKEKNYLSNGDTGSKVRNLQANLERIGYKLEVDGIFGDETEKALKEFQKDNHLVVDGIYGKNSESVMQMVLDRMVRDLHLKNKLDKSPDIIGKSIATKDQIVNFIKKVNPKFNEEIAAAFLEIGEKYGVRGDIAICQSIHETNWFRFGGDVKSDQNNFAGIGATGGVPGNYFEGIKEGVEAQIQHLYGYATNKPLPARAKCYDPRFSVLEKEGLRGSATKWLQLGGKWAWPGYDKKKYDCIEDAMMKSETYGDRIIGLYEELISEPKNMIFTDVSEGSRYYDAAKYFKEKGIVNGYKDGSLRPETEIKRGDMLNVLYRFIKEFNLGDDMDE